MYYVWLYSGMNMSRESKTLKESNSNLLNSGAMH